MVGRRLPPRVRELIRRTADIALNPTPGWLDELDRATLAAASPAIAEDPALVDLVSRANRANLAHFAASQRQNPGAAVRPYLGNATLGMASELARRGLDSLALEVYRIGHNVAWKRWTEIAFTLTSDPEELRELLDVAFEAANEFIDTTLAGIANQMELEYQKLNCNKRAEYRAIAEQILDGSEANLELAETRLAYPLDRTHTAAILWCECGRVDADHNFLDDVADAFGQAAGCPRPLTVFVNAETRWIWAKEVGELDSENIEPVLSNADHARIAVGTAAKGVEGFRRSHADALAARQAMTRLRSRQRIGVFSDIRLVALLTEDVDSIDDFVNGILGDLACANPALRTTVLTYVNQQCNAARAAKRLYLHRNTLVSRLETARRLLPRPLEDNIVDVAVAIKILQWRNGRRDDPGELPPQQHNLSAPLAAQR